MPGLRDGGRVLRSTANPAWLPEGGTAHVVAVADDSTRPEPICVVRALLTHDGSVLVVPRPDGRGLDLPSRKVDGATPDETLRSLVNGLVGDETDPSLRGYVMNVVEEPTDDYPWPTPYAHFAVWHSPIDGAHQIEGTWLDRRQARTQLGQRHWWPLHRLVIESGGGREQ